MKINIYSIFPLLSSFVILFLGIFVFINQSKSPTNRAFSRFSFLTFIWLITSSISYSMPIEQQAFFWLRISYTAVILMPIAFFNIPYAFLNLSHKRILAFLYVISFLFIYLLYKTDYLINGSYKYFWGYYPKAGVLHPIYLIFFIFAVSACDLFLFLNWFKIRKETSLYKQRLQYISLAFIVCTIATVDFIPNYGIAIYPFGWIFIVLYCLIIAYAILRYRLMDIYLAIKRTAAYSLSAGLLMGLFVVLVLSVTNFLSTSANVSSFGISIFAAVLIAILFNPLRNWIQKLIDRVFYKKTYDYYAIIQQVSSSLVTMFEMEKIFQYIGNVINEAMGLKDVYLLASVSGGSFDVVCHISSRKDKNIKKKAEHEKTEEIKVNKFSGILKFFKTSNVILIKDELPNYEEHLGQETIDRIKKDLEFFHGEGIVPVFIDDKLKLLIILGGKISGDIFTNEDINLLKTISVQASIAVKNARLYQEKINSERLASIGMMSATFAHEVRNPLTSLKTFAQLMPEKYNDIEFRDTFSKIVVGEIEKIDGLISDLLDFSSNKKPTRINNINFTELLDKIVDNVKGKLEFEKSNIVVEKNYSADAINMSGDDVKLKQAFSNIIINGCQAMHGEGVLRVNIKPNGKHFDVIVEDTGEGIHPEDLSKIFDPFITTKERGIGLGLAISKRVIEDHKGKIHIKSELSQGTTFTISLPVQNDE